MKVAKVANAVFTGLMFLYTELFLGGLEAMGLIVDHTKDGEALRLKPGKGLIPRSAISLALSHNVKPVFFTDSPQLRDIDGQPIQSGGDRTWVQFVALQIALRYANLQKTHEQLIARLDKLSVVFTFRFPVMGPKAYGELLIEQAKHPGEYTYLIFPGNALAGGKGVPVAFMGTIANFARIWHCSGVQARKLVLSFCKWGQPAFTQETGETTVQNARPINAAVIPEEDMEIATWELHTKEHDGIFFFDAEKVKFSAKRYLSNKVKEYVTVMLRYRDSNPLDVCKGLAVFLSGADFLEKAIQLGINPDVDMITSSGNLKQGDATKYRTFNSTMFDFINLTSQYSGGMSIGRQLQKAGINQKAAYDLFTFCRVNSFKYIPFLDSMIPVYKDPLDVFIDALHDDYEAIMNILMSVDMITFKDCVSLVKRNLFVIRKNGERPKIAKYKTNYNSLAPKLTSFFGNYVIKAHGRVPLAYLIDNSKLDTLKLQVWDDSKVRVNPYIPHVAKRKYINTYLRSTTISEWRKCVLKQPVVGTASIQAIDFVVRVGTGYRMWDPKTDHIKDIAYSQYGDEVTCVMLQQMPADCDGDQIAFAMYPAREGNEFERCPVFDWTTIAGKKKGEVPDTEDDFMDAYLGVISKMRSTIGIVDNIMTKFGCQHILNGTKMAVKESMKMALAFEYWVIKEQMRPGGKGETQDVDAITKLIDTFMGGKEPKTSSIFRFSKDDQGVGYAEGHAKVINWILINARNVVERELPRIKKNDGIFMYQDIVTRIASEFPKQKNHWDQNDSHSLIMKEQFEKAYRAVTTPGAEVVISTKTFARAAESATRINAMYSSRSSNIMDEYRAGKLTKVEKTEAFNRLMGEELAPYLEAEIMEYTATSPDHSTNVSDWMMHRRFERALCIQMGVLGFQKAGTNGGFAFHCSPPVVAFVAALVWPENPICKQLGTFSTAHKNYHAPATVATESND
jgi:hypothetical protein